jgi:hypothetical protein
VKKAISSPYKGCCIVLTTKHQKSIAIAPPFEKILGAGVIEYVADTDRLGTFSGEVERKATALDTAREKCEWGIKKTKAQYTLVSEGSFGPHPFIPFIPANKEILYFIDQKREFHLYVSDLSTDTNYQMAEVSSYEEILTFAEKSLFPSHALIVRTYPRDIKGLIFKGLQSYDALENAFNEIKKISSNGKVWIETDMRAHLNPTRMKVIEKLAETLALRLTVACPECSTPGWGKVGVETGLPCRWCENPTNEIKMEVFGCAKCSYKSVFPPEHGKEKADPGQCVFCNP